MRKTGKAMDLIVRKHIPAWIGRTRNAHRPYLRMGSKIPIHALQIHPVLECPVVRVLYNRRNADESTLLDALIGISYVFRHKREQKRALLAFACPREEIEEVEHSALAAVRQCNILHRQRPAITVSEELSRHFQELNAALRGIIMGKHILKPVPIGEDPLKFRPICPFNLRHACRIAAPERMRCNTCRERLCYIIHQLEDAGML